VRTSAARSRRRGAEKRRRRQVRLGRDRLHRLVVQRLAQAADSGRISAERVPRERVDVMEFDPHRGPFGGRRGAPGPCDSKGRPSE
jgi:hypothetical protein